MYVTITVLSIGSCKKHEMTVSRELNEANVGVCLVIQWLLIQYEQNTEPKIQDSLV